MFSVGCNLLTKNRDRTNHPRNDIIFSPPCSQKIVFLIQCKMYAILELTLTCYTHKTLVYSLKVSTMRFTLFL